MVRFCLNSLVNFAKRFCRIFIKKVTKTEKKSVNFNGNKHRLRTGTESTDKTLKKLP